MALMHLARQIKISLLSCASGWGGGGGGGGGEHSCCIPMCDYYKVRRCEQP